MSVARPLVSVFTAEDPGKRSSAVSMPVVFSSPIRADLVQFVHDNLRMNRRLPYAVKEGAGYGTSAESWGTGRAVARIPRVPGGGTHRAGQAAFGNMCRGGGMFAPTKIWRRWHRKVNLTQRRHAVASALAASAVPGLVMARGHRITEIPELPLVVSDNMQKIQKTKEAMALLTRFGCKEELEKVKDSKKLRAGKGKMRNRRYTMRLGPLIIYAEDSGVSKAFRNIPGVDLCCVDHLNILKIAPGGQMGRFIIWSHSAFAKLQQIYGTYASGSPAKKGYTLPRPIMTNADLGRLINSDEIQSVLRPKTPQMSKKMSNRNPLKNLSWMVKLNPNARRIKNHRIASAKVGTKEHEAVQKVKKELKKKRSTNRKINKKYFAGILATFNAKAKEVLAAKNAPKAIEVDESDD
eukprot:Platyproteum_vivax@DN1172_c0_g1_i1.p1